MIRFWITLIVINGALAIYRVYMIASTHDNLYVTAAVLNIAIVLLALLMLEDDKKKEETK